MLEKLNLAPEFFYTRPEQEKIALDRADLILAIKEEEACFFKSLTSRQIMTLGHFEQNISFRKRNNKGIQDNLKLGFIGSGNSINVQNLESFLDVFTSQPEPLPIDIYIAGGVCHKIDFSIYPMAVKSIGYVKDVKDFYQKIDVAIIPFLESTGLKIKAVEALSYGLPILCTKNASDGLPVTYDLHQLINHQNLLEALRALLQQPAMLWQLQHESQQLFQRIHQQEQQQMCKLYERMTN